MNVINALNNVHRQLDVEYQWIRAVKGLREMSDLEIVQVWNALSTPLLEMSEYNALINYSQLKLIFDRAVKEATQTVELSAPEQCCSDTAIQLLNKLEEQLALYQHALVEFYGIRGKHVPNAKELAQISNDDDDYASGDGSGVGSTSNAVSKEKKGSKRSETTAQSIAEHEKEGNSEAVLAEMKRMLDVLISKLNSVTSDNGPALSLKNNIDEIQSGMVKITQMLEQQKSNSLNTQDTEIKALMETQHREYSTAIVEFQRKMIEMRQTEIKLTSDNQDKLETLLDTINNALGSLSENLEGVVDTRMKLRMNVDLIPLLKSIEVKIPPDHQEIKTINENILLLLSLFKNLPQHTSSAEQLTDISHSIATNVSEKLDAVIDIVLSQSASSNEAIMAIIADALKPLLPGVDASTIKSITENYTEQVRKALDNTQSKLIDEIEQLLPEHTESSYEAESDDEVSQRKPVPPVPQPDLSGNPLAQQIRPRRRSRNIHKRNAAEQRAYNAERERNFRPGGHP